MDPQAFTAVMSLVSNLQVQIGALQSQITVLQGWFFGLMLSMIGNLAGTIWVLIKIRKNGKSQ